MALNLYSRVLKQHYACRMGTVSFNKQLGHLSYARFLSKGNMSGEAWTYKLSSYQEALDALSSLITARVRADPGNNGDNFSILSDYLKFLDLDDDLSSMRVIHVAGTKGKGSTCTFVESILRSFGLHTALFTSPHLIDVRERFRLDGVQISEDKFLVYFWWCWNRLKENANELMPMPTYFRFLALLALKIFSAEKVDVAILEVGLGGKYDATNVVRRPVVCGISSLGYDHMEILGSTLAEIAGEKAGIFKFGVPAFTVTQPSEAMSVLEERSSKLNVHLQVAPPLDPTLLHGNCLGLDGDHQYINAGLAVALCCTWLQRTDCVVTGGLKALNHSTSLPPEFIRGLATANLQGRAQVIHDNSISAKRREDLVFYLDGAHSPESMKICGKWFCHAINDNKFQSKCLNFEFENYNASSRSLSNKIPDQSSAKCSVQILLFNCMSVRDPLSLLPRLLDTCANYGVHFRKALFVPNMSVFNKVGSSAVAQNDLRADVSWQLALQKVWEGLPHKQGDCLNPGFDHGECQVDADERIVNCEHSIMFPSLPLAIKWLRGSIYRNETLRFQVLVTGSLHLIGDVLKLVMQ